MDRDQNKHQQQTNQSSENQQNQRSNVFNESKQEDEKSTINKEQEAALEQERKETLTERDWLFIVDHSASIVHLLVVLHFDFIAIDKVAHSIAAEIGKDGEMNFC